MKTRYLQKRYVRNMDMDPASQEGRFRFSGETSPFNFKQYPIGGCFVRMFATNLLGSAWQPQFFAPSFSEYRNGRLTGVFYAVATHFTSDNEIDSAAESLDSNIFENLIIVGIEADRAANDRTAGHRLDCAYPAHYGVPQERWRLILLGSRMSEILPPKPTHIPDMTVYHQLLRSHRLIQLSTFQLKQVVPSLGLRKK